MYLAIDSIMTAYKQWIKFVMSMSWAFTMWSVHQKCSSYNDGLVLDCSVPLANALERERERLSLSAFLRTEDIMVHIVHISRLIITYTLE